MNWGTIKEAIRQAAMASTGLPTGRVQWRDTDSAGVWMESPWCELALRSPGSIGVDEYRQTYDAITDTVENTVEGIRTFVVSFRLHAETQEDGETALGQLAANLRTRFRRPSVKALLLAEEVALARMESTVDAGYTGDGRSVGLSITDMVFSAAETDVDTTTDGAYIQTVELAPTPGSELEITLVVTSGQIWQDSEFWVDLDTWSET